MKTNKVKPISPAEAANINKAAFEASIPEEVFEAFNELIVKNYVRSTGSSVVKQDEVIKLIIDKLENNTNDEQHFSRQKCKNDILGNHWLDIENFYMNEGWIVNYEKSSYGESYFEAYFKFKMKSGD